MHTTDGSAAMRRGCLIFMSPKWQWKPAVWLLSNFSSLSHYFLFWHSWDLASQKVKYWAYSSSSFVTYSLLFPGFIRAGSDGVAALASGRLREGRKTSVRIMRRQKLEDREMLCQEFTGLQMYAIRRSQIFSWQARELHRTENNSDCLVCCDRWQQPLSEHNEGDPVSAPTRCHTSEELVV